MWFVGWFSLDETRLWVTWKPFFVGFVSEEWQDSCQPPSELASLGREAVSLRPWCGLTMALGLGTSGISSLACVQFTADLSVGADKTVEAGVCFSTPDALPRHTPTTSSGSCAVSWVPLRCVCEPLPRATACGTLPLIF